MLNIEQITQLGDLSTELGDLIIKATPSTAADWENFDKMVAAHRQLRKVDIDAASQLELPIKVT